MVHAVYKIIETSKLRRHEKININNYEKLKKTIIQDNYIKPIIVEKNNFVILDGHHRFEVIKSLGIKKIPILLVDYSKVGIKMKARRQNIKITKELIIKRGIKEKLFPEKSSKHNIKTPNIKIPLTELRENNVFNSTLEMIGNTPLVKINNMHKNKKVNIYAKIESNNPGGSIKDRIALSMIEAAEKNKELTKDKTILEATSGNTGIGLAMVAAIKGYQITLTISEGVSEERKKIIRAYGATIIQTPAKFGTDGAIRKAHEIYEQNKEKYWMSNQYSNPNNPLAHYNTTANEIINQLPKITHFVIAIGTSGTLMGTSKRLKEYNKDINIVAIEPEAGHKVQGLKNMKEAIVPKIFNEKAYDQKIQIKDEIAFETTRLLAKKEGLFVGMSSGAAMAGAIQSAKKMKEGNIVVIFPDRGEKYLSTTLFE